MKADLCIEGHTFILRAYTKDVTFLLFNISVGYTKRLKWFILNYPQRIHGIETFRGINIMKNIDKP